MMHIKIDVNTEKRNKRAYRLTKIKIIYGESET